MKKKFFLYLKLIFFNSTFLLAACNSTANETKLINLPNKEVVEASKNQKTKLKLAAKNISAKNFLYINDFNKIPVLYVETNKLKIINLTPKINYSIISINSKKDDSTIAIIKYKLFDNNKNSIELTQEIKGFKSVQNKIKALNNIAKNIKKIKYIGNKKNFDYTKLNNLDFVFEDLSNNYKFDIIKSSSVNNNSESLKIEYQIYKNEKIKSDVQNATLSEFNFDLKNELNTVAKNITIDYNGKKSKTFVKNIEKTKLIFNNFNKEKFNYEIISIDPKFNDNKIAVIKYLIKSNDKKTNQKSDQQIKEIGGFLKLLNQKELDTQIDNINLTTDRDVMLKNIPLNSIYIKSRSNLLNELELVDIKKTKKSDSEISVSFKIQQKSAELKSKEKTTKITGFRTIAKTVSQLNTVLNRAEIEYIKNKTNNEINQINIDDITLLKISNIYKIAQLVAIPQGDQTTAKIILKIFEIGEKNFSKEKNFIISGFKPPSQKIINLDGLAKNITANYLNAENTVLLSVNDIKSDKIKFNNFDKSKYKININSLMILNNEKTKITIYFDLHEINTKNKSNTHKIDISGFITTNQKLEKLDGVTTKIVVSYPQVKPENLSGIDKTKIDFSGYDQTKYEIVILEFSYDDEGVEDDEIDKSKIYVDFVLVEKNSGFKSNLKSKLINFKKF